MYVTTTKMHTVSPAYLNCDTTNLCLVWHNL